MTGLERDQLEHEMALKNFNGQMPVGNRGYGEFSKPPSSRVEFIIKGGHYSKPCDRCKGKRVRYS